MSKRLLILLLLVSSPFLGGGNLPVTEVQDTPKHSSYLCYFTAPVPNADDVLKAHSTFRPYVEFSEDEPASKPRFEAGLPEVFRLDTLPTVSFKEATPA